MGAQFAVSGGFGVSEIARSVSVQSSDAILGKWNGMSSGARVPS